MMNSIPNDLVYEILLRLPAKSVARCRCLSKLWSSILSHQDFTELFLTKSSIRMSHMLGIKIFGHYIKDVTILNF